MQSWWQISGCRTPTVVWRTWLACWKCNMLEVVCWQVGYSCAGVLNGLYSFCSVRGGVRLTLPSRIFYDVTRSISRFNQRRRFFVHTPGHGVRCDSVAQVLGPWFRHPCLYESYLQWCLDDRPGPHLFNDRAFIYIYGCIMCCGPNDFVPFFMSLVIGFSFP